MTSASAIPPEEAGLSLEGIRAIEGWMRGYVDAGLLPGALALVARHGNVALLQAYGSRDVERGAPVGDDTIFRIYSMTKPVTAVAALILFEEGALGLDDPVARSIPSFENLTVDRGVSGDRIDAEPLAREMTVRHLLTHTSGLTYGEGTPGAISRLYEQRGTDFGPTDGPLAEIVDRLATIPLLFQPGDAWNYGVSSDVLGRVIEVAAGMPLDVFMRTRIFEPLGMIDTCFALPADKLDRFAALYMPDPGGGLELIETPASSPHVGDVTTFSGGAGLLSTATDYLRFAEMLRRRGELEGVRVLERATVDLMTSNQLPSDLAEMGQASFNETETNGVGFGFGVSVVVDPTRTAWRSSLGESAWGGYASTAFWVDPTNDVTVVFMTQLIPSDRYPIRGELRALVRDALLPSFADEAGGPARVRDAT